MYFHGEQGSGAPQSEFFVAARPLPSDSILKRNAKAFVNFKCAPSPRRRGLGRGLSVAGMIRSGSKLLKHQV